MTKMKFFALLLTTVLLAQLLASCTPEDAVTVAPSEKTTQAETTALQTEGEEEDGTEALASEIPSATDEALQNGTEALPSEEAANEQTNIVVNAELSGNAMLGQAPGAGKDTERDETATEGPVELGKDPNAPNKPPAVAPTTPKKEKPTEAKTEKATEAATEAPKPVYVEEYKVSLLSTVGNKSRYEYDQLIPLQFCVKVPYDHDEVSLTYLSTADVSMVAGSMLRTDFPKETVRDNVRYQTIDVQFTISDTRAGSDEEKSGLFNVKANSIMIEVAVWKDGEVKARDVIEVWLLSTPYGVFVSSVELTFSKSSYCKYLLMNDIVTQSFYEHMQREFRRPDPKITVEVLSEYTVSAFGESVSSERVSEIVKAVSERYTLMEVPQT